MPTEAHRRHMANTFWALVRVLWVHIFFHLEVVTNLLIPHFALLVLPKSPRRYMACTF